MFNWFKKPAPVTNGPDFSAINSKAKAEALVQKGDLEILLLLPVEFGGTNEPQNIVYVPRGFVRIKQGIDLNIIKPLVESGKVTEYRAMPEHEGKSFVPIAIQVSASNPGSFKSDINIWGKALGRKAT